MTSARCSTRWTTRSRSARSARFLAITLGGILIVPPLVSEWRFFKRIGRAQELVGLDHRISHVTGFLLVLLAYVLLPFEIAYGQHHLNRLWEQAAAQLERQRLEQGVPRYAA